VDSSVFPMITGDEGKLPFVLKSIGVRKKQENISRPDGYPDFHWLHTVKGSGKLHIGGKEYNLSENTGFFCYPGIPHEYYSIDNPWETHFVTFDGYAFSSLLQLLGFNEYEFFFISDMERLKKMLDDIYISAISPNCMKGYDSSCLLYRFIIQLKYCISCNVPGKEPSGYRQLQPVVSYINENLRRNISLEDVASAAGITPRHLCRLFRQTFHMRPFEYIAGCRIQRAKEMLVSRDEITIGKVASAVGYNDASYFCLIFKKHEGMSPLEFRKIHRD
jgi:AraC family transcriptional regulator, arabinose operon regulatory protein